LSKHDYFDLAVLTKIRAVLLAFSSYGLWSKHGDLDFVILKKVSPAVLQAKNL
jgi:hypothetical protein